MDEFSAGYLDGRDLDSPWPSSNRSDEYRHSFDVGRREKMGSHLTAQQARERANALNSKEKNDASE